MNDRVLITPITRKNVPFQTLNMDYIGPLNPPSAQGHTHCLCSVDNCTLTAKSVCDREQISQGS